MGIILDFKEAFRAWKIYFCYCRECKKKILSEDRKRDCPDCGNKMESFYLARDNNTVIVALSIKKGTLLYNPIKKKASLRYDTYDNIEPNKLKSILLDIMIKYDIKWDCINNELLEIFENIS